MPLPDGALPIYDKDPNITAYVVGEEGENIVAVAKPKRVLFPLFEIASNPEIQLTEIKQRRFDLVERSVDLAKSEIQAEEDRKVFSVMDALATDPTNPNPDIPVTGNLTANLRAERSGIGSGRVYTITVRCTDYAGNNSEGQTTVSVPHDKRKIEQEE